jgi:YggU family uncharacterized protein
VLVSSTLRDLVIGSGLEFEERGAHVLKGVPGEWRLFAANDAVTRLLAAHLDLPSSRVELVSGTRSRLKRFRVNR